MARIVLVGEGMAELFRADDGWKTSCGGDALNVAIHLARFGHDVRFVTALGGDPFSRELRQQWAGEGIDLSLVFEDSSRTAGLYAITTDQEGERSFTYWRGDSAARRLAGIWDESAVAAAMTSADLVFASLISFAILPAPDRQKLLRLLRRVRSPQTRIAYDGNFRPRLWESDEAARSIHNAAIACCDIGLPTFEDEHMLMDTQRIDEVAGRWRKLGAAETVVKLGKDGCLVPAGRIVPPAERLMPVDTTGAGDAFDAGYLDARLRGMTPVDAAALGHRLAGEVIRHRGATPMLGADAYKA